MGGSFCRNHLTPIMNLRSLGRFFRYLWSRLIDAHKRTKTIFDVLKEATIDDLWNIHGDKSLSEPWIDVVRFTLLNQILLDGHVRVLG